MPPRLRRLRPAAVARPTPPTLHIPLAPGRRVHHVHHYIHDTVSVPCRSNGLVTLECVSLFSPPRPAPSYSLAWSPNRRAAPGLAAPHALRCLGAASALPLRGAQFSALDATRLG